MAEKTLHMETTTIKPERTAQEIQVLLARLKANQVVQDYNDKGELTGIRWTIQKDGITIPFALPVRPDPIYRYFQKRRHNGYRMKHRSDQDKPQSVRVAWRLALRWLQVQVAMVDAGLTEVTEVFLPYIELRSGHTLFNELESGALVPLLQAGGLKALPAPEEPKRVVEMKGA